MILGIDLHNIRDGGGVNYIRNLLEAADPGLDEFEHVHLFGAGQILEIFPDRAWITKHRIEAFERRLPSRLWFVARKLPALMRSLGCNILYSPGGIALGNFRPYVTISRNMMPFRPEFWSMYPRFSSDRLRLQVLRWANVLSFERADGMIFLSETAKSVISGFLRRPLERVAVISHGVARERFRPLPRPTPPEGRDRPFRLVYPSRLEPYKHQVEVVRAIGLLAADFPGLQLELCGPANKSYLPLFEAALREVDPNGERIRHIGEVPNAALPELYSRNDLLLFASSCENLPNILIEAMSSGIPICSSDRSPMPEIAQDACLYFDPTSAGSIADSIRQALLDHPTMEARAQLGLRLAERYSWANTARETFKFILNIARTSRS